MGDFNARVGRAAQPTSHIGMHGESNDDVNGNGQLLLSLLSTVNMYALNARTPPPTADAHLTYVKRRSASGEVMGKSLIDYVIASPDIAMPSGATAGPTAFVQHPCIACGHIDLHSWRLPQGSRQLMIGRVHVVCSTMQVPLALGGSRMRSMC